MDEQEGGPEFGRKIISLRTGMIAYGVLAVIAFATLSGYALGVALIVILGFALKSYLYHLRQGMEE